MTDKRKATGLGGLALAVLFGGCLIALFSPRLQVAIVVASFVGYVACTRRALALCRVDDLVFESKRFGSEEQAAREAVRAGLVSGSVGALSFVHTMNATSRPASFGSAQRAQPAYPRGVERAR